MTSVSSYLGEGFHGLLTVVDWVMLPLYGVGALGFLVMLISNPVAKIQNVWLLILHYFYIAMFIGVFALLIHILFWNGSLAWLPPILLWVQFGAMMGQQAIQARAELRKPRQQQADLVLEMMPQGRSGFRSDLPEFAIGRPVPGDDAGILKFEARLLSFMLMLYRKLGRYHPAATRRMADALSNLRRELPHEVVEPLYREALQAARQKWGASHPQTADAMEKLADILRQSDKKEAEDLYRAAVAVRERRQGPEHTATIISKNKLAQFISERERRGPELAGTNGADAGF